MYSIVEQTKALDEGHTLWMIPYDPNSPWYQRLNWLSNFRLTANEIHTRPKMHPWLIKILETCEITPPEIPLAEPLLIPIAQWFPAEWLIMLPYSSSDASKYLEKAKSVWQQFNKPSLRLFLPGNLSFQEWDSNWSHQWPDENISIVLTPQ